MKQRHSVQVTISDKHGGCKLALMNPETILFAQDERGNLVPWQPDMTATQNYLWKLYTKVMDQVKQIADHDDILMLDLGDECHGKKYPSSLVSTRLADQVIIADYVLQPWFTWPNFKHYRLVFGTEAHNAGEGTTALMLCHALGSRFPDIDVSPLYHGLMDFNGVVTDYAHHGPFPGSRNWLRGNVARFYLRDLMQREIMANRRPPDLVMRGHYHSPVYEYLEEHGYSSRMHILPSWCMINDHAQQTTQSQNEITFGLLVTEIEDGKILREHRLYETQDIRSVEVING